MPKKPRQSSPLVGQNVHYWPIWYETITENDQPFAALVCHVNDNGSVNLVIHNEIGIACRQINIKFPLDRKAEPGEASFIS